MTAVKVLIVDDDPMVRDALSLLLSGADGIEVAATAADGDEVADRVRSSAPDVVLMDLRMARVDGITATEQVRAMPSPPEVLVLTTFDADVDVLGAMRVGAGGFLLKDTPPADIVEAIRRVAAGDPVLSPSITRRLMAFAASDDDRAQRARDAVAALSDREQEVVSAIAAGRTNAEIAGELHMSVATVKAHVSHVLTKLDLNNRTQIALLGHDAGLEGG